MWYDDKIAELTDEISLLSQRCGQSDAAGDGDGQIRTLIQRRDDYRAYAETFDALDAEIDTADVAYMAVLQRLEIHSRTSRKLAGLALALIVTGVVINLLVVPSTVLFVACCLLIAVSVGVGIRRAYQHNQLTQADNATFCARQDALDRLLALRHRIEGHDCDEATTADPTHSSD